MLTSLKRFLFNQSLRKTQSGKKYSKSYPYDSIGVLFDATNEKDRKVMLNFVKKLEELGKEMRLLGFYNEKSEELNSSEMLFYSLTDINWYGMPRNEAIETFTQFRSDLIINLLPSEYEHQKFILKQLNYVLMVGPKNHIYPHDIEIDYNSDSFKDYLSHIVSICLQLGILEDKFLYKSKN